MRDWKKPSDGLPNDEDAVEVRLADGRKIKPVTYAGGRFWKYRVGNGGHAYNVVAWREIETPKADPPKRSKVDGDTESTD